MTNVSDTDAAALGAVLSIAIPAAPRTRTVTVTTGSQVLSTTFAVNTPLIHDGRDAVRFYTSRRHKPRADCYGGSISGDRHGHISGWRSNNRFGHRVCGNGDVDHNHTGGGSAHADCGLFRRWYLCGINFSAGDCNRNSGRANNHILCSQPHFWRCRIQHIRYFQLNWSNYLFSRKRTCKRCWLNRDLDGDRDSDIASKSSRRGQLHRWQSGHFVYGRDLQCCD